MTVSNSDRVSRGRYGRMVSGASVCPRNSEAPDVERLGAAGAHQFGHDERKTPDNTLHDAQVIEDGEQGRDEHHRRQDAEGEDKAGRALVADERGAEDESRAREGGAQDRVDCSSGRREHLDARGQTKGQESEGPLQDEPPENHPARDRPAILGEKYRHAQDGQHADRRAEPIGEVLQVQPFGRAEAKPEPVPDGDLVAPADLHRATDDPGVGPRLRLGRRRRFWRGGNPPRRGRCLARDVLGPRVLGGRECGHDHAGADDRGQEDEPEPGPHSTTLHFMPRGPRGERPAPPRSARQ